jgi:spermidine/putrescine transport system ATP-binding protein
MALIEIKDLEMIFSDANEPIIKHINLDIDQNEFISFLGPSGCGKTTLLRILAGFLQPTKGTIRFAGDDLLALPTNKREINTIFQKYALFPHMNVAENIAFGLKIKGLPEADINKRVGSMLRRMKLTGFGHRSIAQLSGGQQQRVAIARALINEPKVLLLDEPLSALDLRLRQDMQYELKTMQQDLGITFIFVTHDQEEAMTMSDRIVVLNNGRIQQNDTPENIYNKPTNRFVADFIGDSNIFSGTIKAKNSITFEDTTFKCHTGSFTTGQRVDCVLRPEHIELAPENNKYITGVVQFCTFKGDHYEIIVNRGKKEIIVRALMPSQVGETVSLKFDAKKIHLMKK